MNFIIGLHLLTRRHALLLASKAAILLVRIMPSLPGCVKLVSVYDMLTYGTGSTVVVPHMISML